MTKGVEPSNQPVLSAFPLPNDLAREFDRLMDLVKSAKKILISSTLTSDGDSIGSQIALLYWIEALARPDSVWIVNESPVPFRYQFLPRSSKILTLKDFESSDSPDEFDLGITLDGGIERTGVVARLFEKAKSSALIDHHVVGSQMTYSAKLLDLDASSTCEIVYSLYEYSGVPLSKEAAEHLYVGIVFDTGFFKHSITKPKTHYVAAQLVEKGIDFSEIADRALLERSWGGQLLLRRLLENMTLSDCGQIVSSYWSYQDLNEIEYQDGDQEGMINQLYFTEGAQAVILFVEQRPNQIKLSFRSKGLVNVAEFARSLNPNGGGHVRAAGTSLEGRLDQVRAEVLAKLKALLDQSRS